MNVDLLKVLLFGRLVAFMLLFYVGFGLIVERASRAPDSKLKGFARLLCRPLTAPLTALSPPGTDYWTILKRTAFAVVALWLFFVVASELAAPR